ncbi:3-dehydroquinate synthase [Catenovulum agarivorans DS-2]|uniref:3-dehydroquinate synthase n=1 Tax=Catenovulum agarivorans DS-2 TaxID=1328313 RepID=W7QRW0_9ALTE|nr:3-dehydroquinate synthase [Catenovulum agarivorans DS-2]
MAVLCGLSLNVQAAEENKDNKNEEKDTTEVIEVTGYKGSVLKSMFEKRNAGNISDSIFAEDIGKSTDQNIADALSRVTGISVQSTDGEGARITVRGANPDQNMITLNGVQLTSSDFNQAVDLSAYSADILSHINVVKTASADHDEGSLGASVQLHTSKPLNLKNDVKSLTLQGRYNDFSEKSDYKLAGSYSEKFFDDSFGVLFTAYKETNSVRRDEFKVNNFEARNLAVASTTDGRTITDRRVLTAKDFEYALYTNERNRHGGTLTLQFLPTDDTDVALDFTYSKQDLVDTNHSVTIRTRPDLPNFIEGQVAPSSTRPWNWPADVDFIPEFSDPQADWFVVDEASNTLVKSVSRFADGGFQRRNGGNSTENKVANLNIKHQITDDFKVEFGANYSNTVRDPGEGTVQMNLLNNTMNVGLKALAGPYGQPHTGIQPAGFDCTTGICEMVFGDGVVSLNDPENISDNRGYSAFSPDDIKAQTINWMALTEQAVEDELSTYRLDFDLDIDVLGFTKIEFGGKYSERSKYVDDQNRQFRNTKVPVQVIAYDEDGTPTGVKAILAGSGIGSITADNFASDEAFPVDNFMEDLGFARNNITDGWTMVDDEKFLALAYANEDYELETNRLNTRSADLTTAAGYFKMSFAYLDDSLTGDFGIRYIKDTVDVLGYSGAEFTETVAQRAIYDPFMWRQLRNPQLDSCEFDNALAPDDNPYFNRIDGYGWDTSGTPNDTSDDVRIPADPAGYPCYDKYTEQGSERSGWWWNQRHVDRSTLKNDVFTGNAVKGENRSLRVFETTGDNEYDMWLPSLNLNYIISEDMIGRFAISKTMSRPNIDSLKPGFFMRESFWGDPSTPRGSSIRLDNPKLLPQESINYDLSWEWYFNKGSMVSVALFYKDMTNFEEEEQQIVYADDLRSKDLSNYSADQLFKTEEQLRDAFANDETGTGFGICMPKRGNINDVAADWWYDDSDLLNYCATFAATTKRNGAGAEIAGIELTYNQSYDFLPGIWGGLGSSFNYTYQDSKTIPGDSNLIAGKALESLPRTWVPQHSYNATVYWEQNGHQVRLAYRGKSDELIDPYFSYGSRWNEGSDNLDLSIGYKVSDAVSVSFQAINLTDESQRVYWTNRDLGIEPELNDAGEPITNKYIPLNEGNALDGDAPTSRTQILRKNGRTFRLDLRVNF